MNQAAMPASSCSSSCVKKKQHAEHCFVPGCKSGCRSSEHKCSLFSVPKDPAVFAQWQRNIPRTNVSLSTTSAVCKLHFEETCIERFYAGSHKINGEVVSLKRDRPISNKMLFRQYSPTCLNNAQRSCPESEKLARSPLQNRARRSPTRTVVVVSVYRQVFSASGTRGVA